MRRPVRIEPVLRAYDWGTRDFIPGLLGRPQNGPVAEAWFGAHPSAPSNAHDEGSVPLDELIGRHPEMLGPRVGARFGRLPFLLKLLSAARPLSIQVHPSKSQAEAGFERRRIRPDEPSSYQDDNHKPELLVALTPFYALCGFQDSREIERSLGGLPELSASLPPANGKPTWLRSLVSAYYGLPPAPRERALLAWLTRLERARPAPDRWEHFALEAHRVFSPPGGADPGLFFFVLLNFVVLEPGHGLYLAAGIPHAYLFGSGVEVMANSDNVLRGGLTNKPVDVPELLRVVRFESTRPDLIAPVGAEDAHYETAATEFRLSRITLQAGRPRSFTSDGPEILLVEQGACRLRHAASTFALSRGEACFAPDATAYDVGATEPTRLVRVTVPEARVQGIRWNVSLTERLFASGGAASVLGCVCGSESARRFWQRRLEEAKGRWGAREVVALHEDLPVNQAFGVLLAWQRIEPVLVPGEGALLSFVFGDGTRATPFTEAESGQKPAMLSFVRAEAAHSGLLPMAELALRHFAPVEAHLRRSGFDGLVIKWGDEVQIPSRDLSGTNPLFEGADVVRFVSLRAIDEDDARNKDWVGVDAQGRVTTFIPRRPLAAMQALADRGILRRDGDRLIGGVNLGSIAMSRRLLTALSDEFRADVGDPSARRTDRPDLDPQFFTALTLACIENDAERDEAWSRARADTPALAQLDQSMPDLFARLCGVVVAFRGRHGTLPRIVAMDFGDPYWGDIGQHRQIREFHRALLDRGPSGVISRALAGIGDDFDEHGNLIVDCELPKDAIVRNSVLIECRITERCDVHDTVLVGTRCRSASCHSGFDVSSSVGTLELHENAGTYRVVDPGNVTVASGKRLTTLFLGLVDPPDPLQLTVSENADLKTRSEQYAAPVEGNPISFAVAHQAATALDPDELAARRDAATARVLTEIGVRG